MAREPDSGHGVRRWLVAILRPGQEREGAKQGAQDERSERQTHENPLQASRAASFSTVFQLRPVPWQPSFFQPEAAFSLERPIPSG